MYASVSGRDLLYTGVMISFCVHRYISAGVSGRNQLLMYDSVSGRDLLLCISLHLHRRDDQLLCTSLHFCRRYRPWSTSVHIVVFTPALAVVVNLCAHYCIYASVFLTSGRGQLLCSSLYMYVRQR